MSLEGDLKCVYRGNQMQSKDGCNCGGAGYKVKAFRCTHPEHRDFCTLSRYHRYQTERICQFCQKIDPGHLPVPAEQQ